MTVHRAGRNNSTLSLTHWTLWACALLLFGCGPSTNEALAPSTLSGQDSVARRGVERLTANESPDGALVRLDHLLSDTEAAVQSLQSQRRPPFYSIASLLPDNDSRTVVLAPAEFRMMHDPTENYDSMAISGHLRIEDNCVYLVSFYSSTPRLSNPTRSVLSLPLVHTRYDSTSEEIYFWGNDGTIRGPFRNGDYVTTGGSPRDLADGACLGQEAFVSHGLAACDNDVRHRLCAHLEYAQQFSVNQREAQRRLQRIPQLVALLDEMRTIAADRVAAWGICHQPFFGARLFLFGETDPNQRLQTIIEGNSDIHIMVGATEQHRNLMKTLDELDQESASPSSITGCE